MNYDPDFWFEDKVIQQQLEDDYELECFLEEQRLRQEEEENAYERTA